MHNRLQKGGGHNTVMGLFVSLFVCQFGINDVAVTLRILEESIMREGKE